MRDDMAEQAQQEAVRKKRFVLVVDGDPRDLHATSMLAQNFGYTATAVRSVEEALEVLKIAAPGLIITELVFPGAGGLSLVEQVKRGPATAAIPVIVQTTHADLKIEEQCRRLGCASYVRKPVTVDSLYHAIQAAIETTPRQYVRIATYLQVSVDGAGTGSELITQLSEDGLFVKTLAPKLAGSRHKVAFQIGGKSIGAEAVVLYTCGFGEGPRREPGMALRFMDLGTHDRTVIQEFIREHLKPAIAPRPAP